MADRVHDDAASVARLGYFTDLGQAQRDRDVALAGTEVTQAKIDALKNVQLFDADAYDPMRPLFPVKPQQYPWAVDEVLAEDYEVREWSVAGGYDPVKKLFKHPTPSEREEFVIPEWLRPYTGNRVHDEFARQTDSWAGYVLAVADGNGGIYVDNNNGQQQTTQNQNGPSGNRPQIEDPVTRVKLRTPDIVYDFHTYFRDYARLGGSVSKDAADMWIHFEAIGLSDSRAFSAYGHPSTDAMLHFYENVRPIVVTSNSQDDTGFGDGEVDLGDNSSGSEELSNTDSPSDIAFVIEATLPNLRWNDEGIETNRVLDISNPSDLHDLVLELGHRHNVYERQLALAERRLTRYSHVLAHGPLPPLGRPDYDSIDRQILGLGGPHMRKKAQEQWELYQQIKLLRRALDEIEQLFVVGGLNKVAIYVRNVNEREDLPHAVGGKGLEQAKLAAMVLMARVPGLAEAMSPLDLIVPGKIAVRGVPLLFRAGTAGVIRRAVTKITPSRATTAELLKTTRNAVSKLLSREAPRGGLPRGFFSLDEFVNFGSALGKRLKAAGYDDVQAVIQGSAVTAVRARSKIGIPAGTPFDVIKQSDFDVALVSPKMFAKAKELGIPLRGKTRTAPLRRGNLHQFDIADLPDELLRTLYKGDGRQINFMIFESMEEALKRGPSVGVPGL